MKKFINIPDFEMSDGIPKIIHQTFSSYDDVPAEIQSNINMMQHLSPDWKYSFHDDCSMLSTIEKYYGSEMVEIYNRINPVYGAARADFFRYLLLYAEGGVYLDIKSIATKPLNDIILNTDRFVLSHWDHLVTHPELSHIDGGEYQQWHIISAKGHPYLRKVIEKVIRNIQNYNILTDKVGRGGVVRLTGPIFYTLEIETYRSSYPHRIVNIQKDFGIKYSVYELHAGDRGHEHIFKKKHYSELIAPIILPETFKDYFLATIFYMKLAPKLLKKKIKNIFKEHVTNSA